MRTKRDNRLFKKKGKAFFPERFIVKEAGSEEGFGEKLAGQTFSRLPLALPVLVCGGLWDQLVLKCPPPRKNTDFPQTVCC